MGCDERSLIELISNALYSPVELAFQRGLDGRDHPVLRYIDEDANTTPTTEFDYSRLCVLTVENVRARRELRPPESDQGVPLPRKRLGDACQSLVERCARAHGGSHLFFVGEIVTVDIHWGSLY